MKDIKSVNIVFIGRGDMLKQLCGVERDSSFAVASATYRGLVVEPTSSISSVVGEDTISKADKVFILSATGDKGEVRDYLIKIKTFLSSEALEKLVVMGPKKLVDDKASVVQLPSLHKAGLSKDKLQKIPFIDSIPSEGKFNSELLKLYPEERRALIQQQYEKFLAEQKRQRDESSPSRKFPGRNPNAILIEMQEEIKASAAAVVDLAERIKASEDKGFVDSKIEELKELKKQFDQKVEKYKQGIIETKDVLRDQLEKPLIASSDEVEAEMEAAVAAQQALDERIAEAERLERERREAEDAAAAARRGRLAKLQEEKILSSVFFDVQREVELDSIEDYVASVNFAEESQNSDVMCVVFDPTLPNCENHLREGVERIKAAQKLNLSVRAVFLRAKPYSIQQDLGFGEDLQAHPEKDSDAQMIKGLDVVDPVIVDNLRDFKDKAGYGDPVVFREENVERVDVGDGFESVGGAESRQELPGFSVVNEPKKNPHRWSGADFKHARFERKAKLNNYFATHGPDKAQAADLNWLELQLLSMEKNCRTAREIKTQVGSQIDALLADEKVNQERYKVVIDLLKLLDKEERRIKPKVITFFANANYSEKYIAKRTEQRDLIYTIAEAVYEALKARHEVTADVLNEILERSGVVQRNGHVQKGIIKILEKNYPAIKGAIHFSAAVIMEPLDAPEGGATLAL